MEQQLNSEFWNNRYLQNETGWDTGAPSPALVLYAERFSTDAEILIPGCGNAYEAEYLLQKSFTGITLLDISPVLTAAVAEKLKAYPVKIVTADFFEHTGSYDLILEQTFFCALDPSLREAYVQKMHTLLKPGGQLAGLLFNRSFEGGPPFGGSVAEYENLFNKFFTIEKMEPATNSIPQRAGSEVFFIARRK